MCNFTGTLYFLWWFLFNSIFIESLFHACHFTNDGIDKNCVHTWSCSQEMHSLVQENSQRITVSLKKCPLRKIIRRALGIKRWAPNLGRKRRFQQKADTTTRWKTNGSQVAKGRGKKSSVSWKSKNTSKAMRRQKKITF